MIIKKDKMWPRDKEGNARITIGFLDGTTAQRQQVKTVANKWMMACRTVKFIWGDAVKSDVRITFKAGAGANYTKLGTDARSVSNKSEATMKLKVWDKPNELAREILHEFGHLLGAKHEHESPYFPYDWNKPALISYWKDTYKNQNQTWNDKRCTDAAIHKVEYDILTTVPQNSNTLITPFDGSSIMMYHFKKQWLKAKAGKAPRDFPGIYELSARDKETMSREYSKP